MLGQRGGYHNTAQVDANLVSPSLDYFVWALLHGGTGFGCSIYAFSGLFFCPPKTGYPPTASTLALCWPNFGLTGDQGGGGLGFQC